MRLSKAEREQVRAKYDGRCAYCGGPLDARWHADHLEPVGRKSRWVRGKGFVPTGEARRPENHRLDNLMPACPPCNLDKRSMSLESWRKKLQGATGVLDRNSPAYRHAKRFGLVKETKVRVTFYFEGR